MTKLHRFSRTELLVGEEGLHHFKQSSVAVIGIGGVGSFAAEALCRAGIGRIMLVDFDDICLTNINRQIHALEHTVGRPKVHVMAERLRQINPEADIIPVKEFFSSENSASLLSNQLDFVLDAIDHITSKVHLIESCLHREISIISSMGAASKMDPSKIRVADISETHKCRMARSMRKILKSRGISKGLKVVFSEEEYREPLSRDTVCKTDCICPNRTEQQFACQHRRIILGSMSYIPSIFGLTMAATVVNELLSRKTNTTPPH